MLKHSFNSIGNVPAPQLCSGFVTVDFIMMKMKCQSLSRVRLFMIPQIVAHQVPLSMGFSRQEYWSGLPFPPPGDLPDPRIEPRCPALQADYLLSELPGKCFIMILTTLSTMGFPGGTRGKEPAYQKTHSIQVGKIPWRRAWQPTPVFLPGKSHGQTSLVGHTESDTTEATEDAHI